MKSRVAFGCLIWAWKSWRCRQHQQQKINKIHNHFSRPKCVRGKFANKVKAPSCRINFDALHATFAFTALKFMRSERRGNKIESGIVLFIKFPLSECHRWIFFSLDSLKLTIKWGLWVVGWGGEAWKFHYLMKNEKSDASSSSDRGSDVINTSLLHLISRSRR